MRLRIESVDGSPTNDYRIVNGHIQFRWLDTKGQPYPGVVGEWRTLEDGDIQLHYALRTIVSKWASARLQSTAVEHVA